MEDWNDRIGGRLWSSWQWCDGAFAPAFEYLLRERARWQAAEPIWRTRSKAVWRIELPAEFGGGAVAFKEAACRRAGRYFLRPSALWREAVNLRRLRRAGIALVEVLAVGETRRRGLMPGGFIVTRFVEAPDGRSFMAGGAAAEDTARRLAFADAAAGMLAAMHRKRFLHQGAHPYNFLWREEPSGEMTLTGLDLAGGYFLPPGVMPRLGRRDLEMLLADLALPAAEERAVRAHYARRLAGEGAAGR